MSQRGRSSVGRAPALQAGGHEFESRRLHSVSKSLPLYFENWIWKHNDNEIAKCVKRLLFQKTVVNSYLLQQFY